ncbi:hypothetical protein BJ170DRAFT_593264 [Xylariales sp. AK1849]|nr:hypothetical protein BJ170DRAFT_593264 [Xylariales sp. AK1849]
MSTVIHYQMRAHMSIFGHMDVNPPNSQAKQQPSVQVEGLAEQCLRTSGTGQYVEHNAFWNLPPSPVVDGQDIGYTKVPTDIRISLKGPSPTLDQDSEEFKKQAREIKKDLQRLSKYTEKHARRKSKSPTRLNEELRQATGELEQQHEFRRCMAVQEARDFLLNFLNHHFEDHLDHITIKCSSTLDEIKMIGNEELSLGVRQCRRLFNAPVISDQIGMLLWSELRQGDSLDHSHAVRSDDEAKKEDVAPRVLSKRGMEELDERKAECMAMQQSPPCSGIIGQFSGQNHIGCGQPSPSTSNEPAAGGTAPGAVEAVAARIKQATSSVPMERKVIDGFLHGIKRRTVKGAGYFAASLATGYA